MTDAPKNLNELFDQIKNGDIDLTDDLPTFGGEEPADTNEVWSWDESNLIVGTCTSGIEIMSRDEWFSIIDR